MAVVTLKAIFGVVVVLASVAWAQEDESRVQTRQGVVQGSVEDTHRVFFGIPHSQPPVGDLRWRAPVAPQAWSGVRDATFRRPDCIQGNPDRTWFIETSEDCLYLNVWTPRVTNLTQPLAVMLFVHGGSNTQGGASIPMYNGRGVIEVTQNVIVVTTNYRLNVFGFLGASVLAAETVDGANGNYAIMDQRAAMLWVRDNIAAFGGNPQRVTIFGESAGSWDMEAHLVFPRSFGLYTAVVMESGASDYNYLMHTQAQADANYNSFASALGCTTIACLRAIPAHELGRRVNLGQFQWWMTIDGVELTDTITNLVMAGRFSRVPVMIGSNEDEIPAIAPRNLSATMYRNVVLALYGSAILQAYPASNYASPWFALQQIITDSVFTCIVIPNAKWMAPYTSVYAYYFTYTIGLTERIAPSLGAFHGTELPFVFHFDPLFINDNDFTTSRNMVAYWTNFARTGNPNTGTQPVPINWPQYAASGANNVHILLQPAPVLRTALKASECAAWDSLRLEGGNPVKLRDAVLEKLASVE